MQAASFRYLVLAVVLLAGAGLQAFVKVVRTDGTPRWPDADSVYASPAWSIGPQSVEHSSNNTDLVTRTYRHPGGSTATLTIVTNLAPKLYGAGAEVPFLGSGYTVESAPPDLVQVGDGVSSLLARRGTEQWLLMYAYGERRGLLGNGPLAWSLALFDGLVGQRSDYYKLYLVTRADQLDARLGQDVSELARTVFPRIASWYAA